MVSNLDQPLTKDESYVQRRQLFRNIWDTSLQVDGKEDILAKPKVIKTLRMDEVDKCPIGKSKKQRIKNLRHVCNRILEFCNRQEADDQFYERIAAAGGGPNKNETAPSPTILKPKRTKIRLRRKHRKVKSLSIPDMRNMLEPTKTIVGRVETTKASASNLVKKSSDPTISSLESQTKPKRRIIRRVKVKSAKTKEVKRSQIESDDFPIEVTSTVKRRVYRKKRIGPKKKKRIPSAAVQKKIPQIISV